jgi:hypothetical protein
LPQFSEYNNIVKVANNTSSLKFNFVNTNLLTKILGFTLNFPNDTLNNSMSVTANNFYNLNIDTYFNFYCPNIPHKSAGFSNQLMTFKIPFNSTNGSIFYESENINYSHYVKITDQNFILDKLKIQIFDQFNYLLDNNGFNWSFTLGFDFYE